MVEQYTLVFDIGKTHVKLEIVDSELNPVAQQRGKNQVLLSEPYPQANVDGIWEWFVNTLKNWELSARIQHIVVTTHGATAALIHENASHDNGLVLPVLDYEYNQIHQFESAYRALRPAFAESFSPDLPAGLNLARQLYWQSQAFADEFSQASHILMYPQYWVWRLTGRCSTEVTSLGCHTDLWAPRQQAYSSLVKKLKWQSLLGTPTPAWQQIGSVQDKVCELTGLRSDCKVYGGIHDSNASYLRYLQGHQEQRFTVISSGTWTILMTSGSDVELDESRDMLANVDVNGNPVACARFMGGREYETICSRLGGNTPQLTSADAVQVVLDKLYLVSPDFSDGNGPFGGQTPLIQAPPATEYAQAIATVYCALMIDFQLTQLNASGKIYIEGAFLQNTLMCQLVAQLRPEQSVWLSSDGSGTVQGAALLSQWQQKDVSLQHQPCAASQFSGLQAYKQRWLTVTQAGA